MCFIQQNMYFSNESEQALKEGIKIKMLPNNWVIFGDVCRGKANKIFFLNKFYTTIGSFSLEKTLEIKYSHKQHCQNHHYIVPKHHLYTSFKYL